MTRLAAKKEKVVTVKPTTANVIDYDMESGELV